MLQAHRGEQEVEGEGLGDIEVECEGAETRVLWSTSELSIEMCARLTPSPGRNHHHG